MKKGRIYSFIVLYTSVFLILPATTVAGDQMNFTGNFTGQNWFIREHPLVANFSIHTDGSMTGITENGIPFRQYGVPNEFGIRVQRFEIEDHHHYIVEGEIAYTFTELSSLLAQAYARLSHV